jgi:nucleoside-triphosphatase THEP1
MIIIVTGNRAVGKTSLLLKFIEEQKNKNISICGIMTPAIYDGNNKKVGFYALDIASGEKWELGRSDKVLSGPEYGPFTFCEKGFRRANDILGNVFLEGEEDIILDEVGPLEMDKHYGFFTVLSLISVFNNKRNLYIVIRPELIKEFVKSYLSKKEYRIIEITLKNREIIVI